MIIVGLLGTALYYISVFIFFIIYTPICFIVWIFTTPFDKYRVINHRMNSLVGFMLMFLNPFWRTKVHGLENVDRSQTYVIAPNHQSMTDICILASTNIDLKWVSKKELTYVPFLGWIMAMAKDVLLDRKDPKSQFKMMRSCEDNLKNNISVAIFPEGTRSTGTEMGKFRDGASLLARKTDKMILPVCNYRNYESRPQKGLIWTKKTKMDVYFLEPIDPADYKTKELSNLVKQAIQNKMEELTALELKK